MKWYVAPDEASSSPLRRAVHAVVNIIYHNNYSINYLSKRIIKMFSPVGMPDDEDVLHAGDVVDDDHHDADDDDH